MFLIIELQEFFADQNKITFKFMLIISINDFFDDGISFCKRFCLEKWHFNASNNTFLWLFFADFSIYFILLEFYKNKE